MTDKKCPKCGSATFQICDECVQELIYEVTNGYVEADGEGGGGTHIRTTCYCRECGYIWHPRNFNFIIDE